MGFYILSIDLEIHKDTGNLGRLSLGYGSKLHLVKPFGFELSDARSKRGGLYYWNIFRSQFMKT